MGFLNFNIRKVHVIKLLSIFTFMFETYCGVLWTCTTSIFLHQGLPPYNLRNPVKFKMQKSTRSTMVLKLYSIQDQKSGT